MRAYGRPEIKITWVLILTNLYCGTSLTQHLLSPPPTNWSFLIAPLAIFTPPTIDHPGPLLSPHRTYDFTTIPTTINHATTPLPTRIAVILNQIFNIIEPTTMWTNSTSAAANTAAITISSPGKYILAGDLQINAQNSGTAGAGVIGIDITSSNVTLDLNGYTISQSATSVAAGITGVVGIRIKNSSRSLYNITIQNGQLNGIGNGTLDGTGLIIGEGTNIHYSIKLTTLRITNCAVTGIQLNKIDDSTLDQISVTSFTNTKTGSDRTTYGLYLTNCNNLTVRDARFSDLAATAANALNSTVYGIYLNSCTNITCINCATDNNASTITNGGIGTTAGIYSNASSGITCQNCVASYNATSYLTSGTVTTYGVAFVTTLRSLIRNCTALAQTNPNGDAVGIYVAADSKYILLDGNTCLGQTGTNAYGIYFGDGNSTGPTNCIVQNCQLYDNIGTAKSFGFKDFASATIGSTTTLAHNVAGGQGGINPSGGNIIPTNSNNCNYYILYAQGLATHASNQLFLEANFAQIGAVNTTTTTGTVGEFQNLSVIS